MSTQRNKGQDQVSKQKVCLKTTLSPSERGIRLNPKRAFRYYMIRLLRLRGDPFELARGISIGIFVALTPTIPFHTILTVTFCTIGRGNLLAGVIASLLISNPITIPLQYLIAWKLGTMLTGTSFSWQRIKHLMDMIHHAGIFGAAKLIYMQGFKLVGSMLVGGVALALPCAIIVYFLFLYLYMRRKKRQKDRIFKKYGLNDLDPKKKASWNP